MLSFLRAIDAKVPKFDSTFAKLPNGPLSEKDKHLRQARRRIISLVGVLAVVLIPFVWLMDLIVGDYCMRDSLSHYIYSPYASIWFVVAMASVGMLLLAYKGDVARDTRWAWAAGVGALMVAVFPTEGPGFEPGQSCDVVPIVSVEYTPEDYLNSGFEDKDNGLRVDTQEKPIVVKAPLTSMFQINPVLKFGHYAGVVLLVVAMSLFCGVFFRLADSEDLDSQGQLKRAKVIRNCIYLGCTAILLLSGLALLVSLVLPYHLQVVWRYWNGTFWVELLSFVAIGFAWLVKGRVFDNFLKST